VPQSASSKKNIIATLCADIILLLIMLVGLLRIRLQGGGTFALGRLLWTQVRCWQLSLVMIQFTDVISAQGYHLDSACCRRPGPGGSTFRLSFFRLSFSLISVFTSQVLICLNLNGGCFFFSNPSMMNVNLTQFWTKYQIRGTSYVVVVTSGIGR